MTKKSRHGDIYVSIAPALVCLAVHGILAEDARARLETAGAKVVTTNTIPGPSALLDIHPVLAGLTRVQI